MVLAGDSYEMKILCVAEQNYLVSFFLSPLLSPFSSKGVVGTVPLKFLCFPSSHFSPQDMEEITLPGWSSVLLPLCCDREGSAQPGGVGEGAKLAVLLRMRLHLHVACSRTLSRQSNTDKDISWLLSFLQLEDVSCSGLSLLAQPLRRGAWVL